MRRLRTSPRPSTGVTVRRGALALALLTACQKPASTTATQLFTGGSILTMAGDSAQYAEAVAVRDGKILAVGRRADVSAAAGASATVIDLHGQTMLPGFIDGHSHLFNYAEGLAQANLNPPPVGTVASIKDIVRALQALAAARPAGDSSWLVGSGYDADQLAEHRHPTAADLDEAFPTTPVVLIHASSHMLVANSAALRKAGVTETTADPPGGTIVRKPGTRVPEGLVQETAGMMFIPFVMAPKPPAVEVDLVKRAVAHYASYGITTAAEHVVMPEKMALLRRAADSGAYTIDLVAALSSTMINRAFTDDSIVWGRYAKGLKFGGIKVVLDGSPQGKTAFVTKPFLTPVPGCTHDCRGLPSMTQADADSLFLQAYRKKVQIFTHANGDAAVDIAIAAHRKAEATLGDSTADRRTVIIHSQIMRPDQMAAYQRNHLLPSFFTNHVFFWGDVHAANLGSARANYLSPLKSALAAGIKATNHTDEPVTPINPLFLLWTSVNRVSRSGVLLGADERVTPYQGLQALTTNGAYEYFEEGTKGTIAVGKDADLVILDKNPLTVDPMAIKDIRVMTTIKRGTTVFTRTSER
ncbi:MAG: amidohydrolase [Gemmatimonadaceae bacterium]